MKKRIIFIERQAYGAVSIERVFAQVAMSLPEELFDVEFHKLSFGYGLFGILKGLIFFRKRPADIYHVTGEIHYISLRLPKKNTVLTIHDLGFIDGLTFRGVAGKLCQIHTRAGNAIAGERQTEVQAFD